MIDVPSESQIKSALESNQSVLLRLQNVIQLGTRSLTWSYSSLMAGQHSILTDSTFLQCERQGGINRVWCRHPNPSTDHTLSAIGLVTHWGSAAFAEMLIPSQKEHGHHLMLKCGNPRKLLSNARDVDKISFSLFQSSHFDMSLFFVL